MFASENPAVHFLLMFFLMHTCAQCKRSVIRKGKKMQVCGSCHVVRFCSQQCMVKAWKWHQKQCAQLRSAPILRRLVFRSTEYAKMCANHLHDSAAAVQELLPILCLTNILYGDGMLLIGGYIGMAPDALCTTTVLSGMSMYVPAEQIPFCDGLPWQQRTDILDCLAEQKARFLVVLKVETEVMMHFACVLLDRMSLQSAIGMDMSNAVSREVIVPIALLPSKLRHTTSVDAFVHVGLDACKKVVPTLQSKMVYGHLHWDGIPLPKEWSGFQLATVTVKIQHPLYMEEE